MAKGLVINSFWQFLGRAVSAGSGLILIPIGLHYFSAEQYGVIGVYLSFVSVIGILSLGLPAYINRELSVLLAKEPQAGQEARLVRSYELYFGAVTALCLLVLLALAYAMPRYWLTLKELTINEVTGALVLAAITGAVRFPISFYNNVLYAQERHKLSSIWLVWLSLARVVATALWLEYGGATLANFFYAQIIFYAAECFGLAAFFWYKHAAYLGVKPDFAILRSSRSMAFSMMAVTVSGHIKTQSDKVILTYMLPLAEFGIYSAAYSIALGIVPLAYSVVQAAFPVMSKQSTEAELTDERKKTLAHSTLLLLTVTMPIAIALIAEMPNLYELVSRFSKDAVVLADSTRIMLLGSACYVLSLLPNMFHIARGRPNTLLWVNLAHIPPYMVMIFYLTGHYGLTGAAWSFTLLQACFVAVHYIILCQKRFSQWKAAMRLIIFYCICVALFAWCLTFWPAFAPVVPALWAAMINMAIVGLASLALSLWLWRKV